jgi:hypothetical protein
MTNPPKHNVFGEHPDTKMIMVSQGAMLMARGAAYGAALFFGTLIFVWIVALVGTWLPEQSKQMPDPHNRGAIELPAETPLAVSAPRAA